MEHGSSFKKFFLKKQQRVYGNKKLSIVLLLFSDIIIQRIIYSYSEIYEISQRNVLESN